MTLKNRPSWIFELEAAKHEEEGRTCDVRAYKPAPTPVNVPRLNLLKIVAGPSQKLGWGITAPIGRVDVIVWIRKLGECLNARPNVQALKRMLLL